MELDLAIRTAKLLGYKFELVCSDLYIIRSPLGPYIRYKQLTAIPTEMVVYILAKDLKLLYGIELDTPQITV